MGEDRTGRTFERQVAECYRDMGAHVKCDVWLLGHQIDVYVETTLPDGSLHHTAVEAKDWQLPVGINVARDWALTVEDLRRAGLVDEGIIVSSAGFSKQARKEVADHGQRGLPLRLVEWADLHRMKEWEGIDWKALQEKYLGIVRDAYRQLPLRGLDPHLEGPTDLSLPAIYVPLELVGRPKPPEVREPITRPLEDTRLESLEEVTEVSVSTGGGPSRPTRAAEPASISEDRSEPLGPMVEHRTRDSERRLAEQEESTRIVNIWDGLAQGRVAIVGEPGSGKTTIVKYLALALAGEPGTEVDRRFANHLPIVARLQEYSRNIRGNPGLSLADHLCIRFQTPEFRPLLERELRAGQCVVLLDGLDEVEASNLPRVVEQIEDFAAGYGNNRIVVTSRQEAYRQARISRFEPLTIRRMDFELIRQFIDHWYRGRGTKQCSARDGEPEAEHLIQELERRHKLRELAQNPLMLTIITLMHWRGTVVPSGQVEVYQCATDTLLEYWPFHQDRPGIDVLHQDRRYIKQALQPVAYHVLSGNGRIREDELLRTFAEVFIRLTHCDQAQAHKKSIEWLDPIRRQSGLLVEQKDEPERQEFEFLHRRFAEYLAACYLSERWDNGEHGFVLNHVHRREWSDVVVLFIAQQAFKGRVLGTKALRAIADLKSPWEEVVWRDLLLAGQCLGENILVDGELHDEILGELAHLLTGPHKELRDRAITVLANLSGTQYQPAAIERISDLVEDEWPWPVKVTMAKALAKLGERDKSHHLLVELRDTARRRGYSSDMAQVIELLLEGWKGETLEGETLEGETLDWLVSIAREYDGRGLILGIGTDPRAAAIAATDESFDWIGIGEHLGKEELRGFVARLDKVLVSPEQHERIRWLQCQFNDFPTKEVRQLATEGQTEDVRLLAAKWLAEHSETDDGRRMLAELAAQRNGNLLAVAELIYLGERESAIEGTRIALTRTLDAGVEQVAATLLIRLGEKTEAAAVLVGLLLFQGMTEEAYRIAEILLNTTAREVGLAALKTMAASVQYSYRYESAIALGRAGAVDEAYQTLLDIATRRGVLDRANAIAALSDPRYKTELNQDQHDLCQLGRLVVDEVSDRYTAVATLLEAGIVPDTSGDTESTLKQGPTTCREEWERRAREARATFAREAEKWLWDLPEQSRTHPYAQAAMAYLLAVKDERESAIAELKKAAVHPEASAQLLLRVGAQLLELKAREAGLEALNRVPIQSADDTEGWLGVALVLGAQGEADLALEATHKAAITTKFQVRRGAALLLNQLGHVLNQLGHVDEGRELLVRGIEAQVPRRQDWLLGSDVPQFMEMLLDLAGHLLTLDPQYVQALVGKAETLRRLERFDEALAAVDDAIKIDNQYALAWGVRGETLVNMGRRKDALVALQKATELNSRYEWAWRFKAETHREIGQYENALASIEQSLEISERNPYSWVTEGETLENTGRREEALAALEWAIELNPDDAQARVTRAETLRRLGQCDQALEAVEQALRINGSYPFAWRVKSETLCDMDRYDDALVMLREALSNKDDMIKRCAVHALAEIGDTQAIDPLLKTLDGADSAEVRQTAAWGLGRLGNLQATEGLSRALKDVDSAVRNAAADALATIGERSAADALVNALEDPDIAVRGTALQALGFIADEHILGTLADILRDEEDERIVKYAAMGLARTRSEVALRTLQQAAAKRPGMAELYSQCGVLLRKLGQLEEAIEAHNEAIRMEQNDTFYYARRAMTNHARTEYELATEDYRMAISLDPGWAGSWDGLGCALFEMSQDNEALSAWWRAKSLSTGDPFTLTLLGIGLWITGRQTEAQRLWRRAVVREPRLAGDRSYMRRELVWGPRAINVAQEIAAALNTSS